MSEPHTPGSGDELHIEVGDASAPVPAASRGGYQPAHHVASASLFASRLTRRGRILRAAGIAGTILLALVVVLGSIPATRNGATKLLASFYPTPTASIIPGTNGFFLLPNPPGTTVLLDGNPLASIPYPGDAAPLLLSSGTHTFAWRNTRFPFRPLSCVVSVPSGPRDTCPLIQPYQVPTLANGSPLAAPIIADRLSLSALPDDQAAALTGAVQAALDSLTANAPIAPGDHYLDGNGSTVDTATQPLTAVFQVRPILQAGADPCFDPLPMVTCPYLGQEDCDALCTLQSSPTNGVGAGSQWLVGTPVQVQWMYVASDGTVIASQVAASGYGIETALLGVRWDGTTWQAQPIFGQHGALQASDNLACDAALYPLSGGPVNYLFYPDASYTVSTQYASGAQVSDGCVVRMTTSKNATAQVIPGSGTALYLERFGVLLAASDAAHYLWPDLPQADAAERQAARQLAAVLT